MSLSIPRATLAFACLLSACGVDPYCFDCRDETHDGGGALDGSISDGGGHRAEGGSNDAGPCFALDGAVESCNMLDDDCDGTIDESFDLTSDPANCGQCGNQCRYENGEGQCSESVCEFAACFTGFVDLDQNNSCEYACPVFPTRSEECNGFDDDCDGSIDEPAELPPPPDGLCRTTPGTPCETVRAVCATREGRSAWFCDYPDTVEFDPIVPNGIVLEETRCDGFDGDCDGLRDESFPTLGTACDNGERGACRDQGVISCDSADSSATVCNLNVAPDPSPGAPSAELCNGIDDDCDGIVDNSDPSDPARVRDDMQRIRHSSLDFWIFTHEASRPDATSSSTGASSARACGSASVLPWTNVSEADAAAACEAAGHRLCTAAEWLAACQGAAGNLYPYGSGYEAATCNGADRDASPGGAIDSRVEPTGSLAMCSSADGVLDMSGNIKEWTADQRGTTSGGSRIFVVRGGSRESPAPGLTCVTDLSRATEDTLLPTLGFRCCDSDGP